jgi:hypothetical protein
MTKEQFIEKALTEVGLILVSEPDPKIGEKAKQIRIVTYELQRKLPDTEIKTCEDFKHVNVTCRDACHKSRPHYDMKLIDLLDGSKVWVCDEIESAIYAERYVELVERVRNSPGGKLFRERLGFDDFPKD